MKPIIHESGIKIFKEFIDHEALNQKFFYRHKLCTNDVFLISGTAYRVNKGDNFYATRIKAIELEQWVRDGNNHSNIKWHYGYPVYVSNHKQRDTKLLAYRGKTYFYDSIDGHIFDCAIGECLEYTDSFNYY